MDWKYINELDAFEIYEKVKEEQDSEVIALALSLIPALKNGLTGAAGSAISNVATYPLDLVVTRLQVQTKDTEARYDGLSDAVTKIYEDEGGIPGFYAGVSHDTVKSAIDSFLFFLAYNVAWTLRKAKPPSTNAFMQVVDGLGIGVFAGAFTKAVTMPIQNVVTRKQTERAEVNSSVADIVATIHKDKGIAGFWSGYSASLVLTLNPAVTFFLDAAWRKLFRLKNPNALATFLLAAFGKATASLLMYPFKMAKSRAQTQGGEKKESNEKDDDTPPENVLLAIPYIARTEGVAALYAGVWGEVLKGFFTHGLTMLVKDQIQFLALKLYYVFATLLGRQSRLKH